MAVRPPPPPETFTSNVRHGFAVATTLDVSVAITETPYWFDPPAGGVHV